MGRFYFDRGYFSGKTRKWVSFESTPGLENTKKDIYGRCVPCITGLYEQLKEEKKEIALGPAYHCWKVVIVLEDDSRVLSFLQQYERRFLAERTLKGRFGSGDETKETRVIVFNVYDEGEKDRLLAEAKTCAEEVGGDVEVFSHRACGELYHDLLGDWRNWR
ncbi:MAG: hypothetical protein JW821_00080, partial [Deltaproteobacteria bacterium]|nr:hypothetical protein [Deltaproteobacteria bacterium]